ncbi:DinB family protein [Ferruginibacter sp. SUN002]|uniref:DinB family protein n=1 Tax=Ferruginibacter sp. SUN002 TaxID=2937789 RepID=UPI003D35DAA3
MTQAKQIANRFREIIFNGEFVAGTNYKAQLCGVDWKLATQKTVTANTIAALTFHVHYYIAGMLNVLEGGPLDIKDKFSFDMPPITSQEAWEQLLDQLWKDAEKFASFVELLTDKKLQEDFTDEKYGSYQRNIDAMIEHSYYHLGQIVLIKKLTA